MGRYDHDLKCAEVRKLVKEKKFDKAYEKLQTIDVLRVKNLMDYKAFYEVYSTLNHYDDAKEMLIRMYQRTSSKRFLYKLVRLAIRSGKLEEAEACYQDYSLKDPDSEDRYILRYLIDKAKHADYDVRIDSLEKIKKIEYYEDWGYELAKMYHKAGYSDKCVEECSDLILWFGEGIIVEKAKLLKDYYVNGNTSFLGKEVKKDNKPKMKKMENIDNESDTLYNTKDLGMQVLEIKESVNQDRIKKELKQDLSLTMNIRQAIKDELEQASVSEETKPSIQEEEKIEAPKVEEQDTETLVLPDIKETAAAMLAKREEDRPDVMVGKLNLTELFGYYLNNKEVEDQLVNCFTSLEKDNKNPHFYITGDGVTDNMDFVKKLAKALQHANIVKKSQVARVKGENLNHIHLDQRVEKLRNSILLIEGVSSLYFPTVKSLMKLMKDLDGELVVVFDDTRANIKLFTEEQYELNELIKYTINL